MSTAFAAGDAVITRVENSTFNHRPGVVIDVRYLVRASLGGSRSVELTLGAPQLSPEGGVFMPGDAVTTRIENSVLDGRRGSVTGVRYLVRVNAGAGRSVDILLSARQLAARAAQPA